MVEELEATLGSGELEAAPDPLKPGDMVGEYQIEGLLGRGGMGWVYAGIHPIIEKQVAVKVLKPALAEHPEAVRRFVSEAKAVNRIRHPNIIDIFAFGQLESGANYFIMEHLPGESLSQRLASGAPVTYGEATHILAQIMNALEAAHDEGIIHRDLKPDNIYLARHKHDPNQVKLLDFGIAKLTEDGVSRGRTSTGVPIGTPAYMSPEQCHGKAVDHRSDIYALGVVLYELFTGDVPFAGNSYMEVVFAQVNHPPPSPSQRAEIPPELESLILWCLQKAPEARPDNVAAVRRPLLDCLGKLAEKGAPARKTTAEPEAEAVPYAPTVATGQADDPARSTTAETSAEALAFAAPRGRRRLLVAGALTAVIAVLGAVLFWYGTRSSSRHRQAATGPANHSPRAEVDNSNVAGTSMATQPSRPEKRDTMPAMAPAAKHTVTVQLRSTPPGAAVYHNGRRLATTPTDLVLSRDPKPQRFRFVLGGRQTVTRTVTLVGDVEVNAKLPRALGSRRPRTKKPRKDGFKLTQ